MICPNCHSELKIRSIHTTEGEKVMLLCRNLSSKLCDWLIELKEDYPLAKELARFIREIPQEMLVRETGHYIKI